MAKTIPQISIESQTLIKLLITISEGQTVTYDQMSEAINRDVRKHGRSSMTTARRRLAHDEGIYFEPEAGVGLRRCTDREKATCGAAAVKHIGATARRAVRKLTAVQEFDKLPRELQVEHNASVSMLGALGAASGMRKLESVRKAVNKSADVLPLAKTLAVLAGE